MRENLNSLNDVERDHHLRGLAIELVVQLPKDQEDALKVLEYAQGLVKDFLPGKVPASRPMKLIS